MDPDTGISRWDNRSNLYIYPGGKIDPDIDISRQDNGPRYRYVQAGKRIQISLCPGRIINPDIDISRQNNESTRNRYIQVG
jgi:hypothetical protein